MPVSLDDSLFSIKHLAYCELPGITCKVCNEEVSNKLGYFILHGHNSYWCCMEHGIKERAIDIKGTDAWTLAIMVKSLQEKERRNHE